MSEKRSIIQKICHAVTWRVVHFYHAVFKNYINDFWAIIYALKTRVMFSFFKVPQRHGLPADLIVSLTSFPPRFGTLDLTIKCLLMQDVSPDKVILWVAEGDDAKLPVSVTSLTHDMRFEIKTCQDMGSYKKLIPTLTQFPDAFIVTADDDIYYAGNWLNTLLKKWNGNYREVIAHRVHRIKMASPDKPMPYNNWDMNIMSNESSDYYFATSGAGMLFSPQSFDSRVLDEEAFLKLCPNADDVWFFWMLHLNGKTIRKTDGSYPIITWRSSQKVALFHENVFDNKNDAKINALIETYGWPVK